MEAEIDCTLQSKSSWVNNGDFVVNDPEGKGRETNFLATVLDQSRLNRIAAIYTALAILFQAAASSPLIESWIRQ
jgi:hypothetical protein